jgi:hypothetical protein
MGQFGSRFEFVEWNSTGVFWLRERPFSIQVVLLDTKQARYFMQ